MEHTTELLAEDQWRPAHAFYFQVYADLDAVGDFNEWMPLFIP